LHLNTATELVARQPLADARGALTINQQCAITYDVVFSSIPFFTPFQPSARTVEISCRGKCAARVSGAPLSKGASRLQLLLMGGLIGQDRMQTIGAGDRWEGFRRRLYRFLIRHTFEFPERVVVLDRSLDGHARILENGFAVNDFRVSAN
jgi:hypothetical protein